MDKKIGMNAQLRIVVVAVDATRARLFTFEEPADAAPQKLLERMTLVDPARRQRASELFSDSRPGLDRAPSGRGFAVDDRRDAALQRMDRDFAVDIAEACGELVRAHGSDRLIVAASPRMLGLLRELAGFDRLGVELREIDRNLAHLSSPQLHDYLAQRDLLPERERVGLAAPP